MLHPTCSRQGFDHVRVRVQGGGGSEAKRIEVGEGKTHEGTGHEEEH